MSEIFRVLVGNHKVSQLGGNLTKWSFTIKKGSCNLSKHFVQIFKEHWKIQIVKLIPQIFPSTIKLIFKLCGVNSLLNFGYFELVKVSFLYVYTKMGPFHELLKP